MKLHIENININKILENEKQISEYIIYSNSNNYIFSDDGILLINKNNNKLNKVNIIDEEIIKGNLNTDISYIIDNSYFKIDNKCVYNIPMNHVLININTIKYKFCENDIYFIIEKYNDVIKYVYFNINDTIENINNYSNDIISFLLKNNLY
jgi:hypothetical protein